MSVRPVDSQVAITRTPELAAERLRDIRMTGLTTGTLNEIAKDSEEDLRAVKDKYEVEMLKVRGEDNGESTSGQEKKENEEIPPEDEEEELRRLASERFLSLSVMKDKNKEVVSKRFDITV
jgi:hypothetical protein